MKWFNTTAKLICILFLACYLAACSSEINYAPVTDVATIEHIPQSGIYHVAPGETLYSIAWRYGLDYRYLANLNHISPPFHVVAGQKIYLSSTSASVHKVKMANQPPPARKIVEEHETHIPVDSWRWPARGSVINHYSSLNKGVNIGGRLGNSVYATAAGRVVYSGSGLRGYGKLIIIKHNTTFLSAYAHNRVNLVKEGQRVRAGQKIAEMGNTGASKVMLHFEIRRNGQPVNPLNYLN